MGKGRRPRTRDPRSRQHREEVARREEGPRRASNADRARGIGGPVPLDAARDAALPLVDHARLALEVRYEGDTPMARLLALVRGSALPERAWLANRLEAADAAERLVDDAVAAWFGSGTSREDVARMLAEVDGALRGGRAVPEGWQVGDRVVPVRPGTSIHDTVDALLAGLGGPDRGGAIVGLCRQLHLAVLLDEEEDEEEVALPETD